MGVGDGRQEFMGLDWNLVGEKGWKCVGNE